MGDVLSLISFIKLLIDWLIDRLLLRRSHSHLTPPLQQTPANIHISLTMLETLFIFLLLYYCVLCACVWLPVYGPCRLTQVNDDDETRILIPLATLYMGSSVHFRTVLSESQKRLPISCRAHRTYRTVSLLYKSIMQFHSTSKHTNWTRFRWHNANLFTCILLVTNIASYTCRSPISCRSSMSSTTFEHTGCWSHRTRSNGTEERQSAGSSKHRS